MVSGQVMHEARYGAESYAHQLARRACCAQFMQRGRSHWFVCTPDYKKSMDGLANRSHRSFVIALLLTILTIRTMPAQDTTSGGRTIIPRDTANAERHQTLFTSRDAALALGFVGLTVAMFPADKHFAISLQDPDLQANKFFGRLATGVETIPE